MIARDDQADEEPLEHARLAPLLREHGAGEGQVTGLLGPVVAVDLADERVGVAVLHGQLLHEIGDLLTTEDQDRQQRLATDDLTHDEELDRPQHRERVAGGRRELAEQAAEQPGVARLLADLVQGVDDAADR